MKKNQFDRYALSYAKNSELQREIAKKLLSKVDFGEFCRVVDIGCGDGAVFDVCKSKGFFVGVDASAKMCELHSSRGGCITVCGDFDDRLFVEALKSRFGEFDLLISSSSLQWSATLNETVKSLSLLSKKFAISIFTDGTFAGLREFLGIESSLPSAKEARGAFDNFSVNDFWIESYSRKFASSAEAVRYIKNSGVSGGGNIIGYKEAKRLYRQGPLELEFEVVYLVGSFEKSDFSVS